MPKFNKAKREPRRAGTYSYEKLVEILCTIYPPDIVSDILDDLRDEKGAKSEDDC